jgi:hypothetical protein
MSKIESKTRSRPEAGSDVNETAVHQASTVSDVQSNAGEPGDQYARLDRNAQTTIGRQLRAMFDDLTSSPVPQRFRDLLDQLDKQEKQK